MRRIERETLAPEITVALRGFQDQANTCRELENFDPGAHWTGNRGSQPILEVVAALKRMSGKRKRCMYCVDSEAGDIEHFWPKSKHPNKMYLWKNLLFDCTRCGRFKGIQFPQSADGEPLLIDPTAEDPWDFLDFDPETGNLNARFVLPGGEYSLKGETTVRVLHLDRREGVSNGYLKSYRRLCQLVTGWTEQHLADDYLEQLREADDHGLLGWFLHGSGVNDRSFRGFRERYREAWDVCLQSLL